MKARVPWRCLGAVVGLAVAGAAPAGEAWQGALTLGATGGAYQDSRFRDGLREGSAILALDWADRAGAVLGWTGSRVAMNGNAAPLDQGAGLASLYAHVWPMGLPGRWSGRLDVHRIDNDDRTGMTDGVSAATLQLSWLSADRQWYADLGYSASHYPGRPPPALPAPPSLPAPELDPRQWTPTFGFAFGEQWHWLRLRAFLIDGLEPRQTGGQTATTALEVKYTRWFAPRPAPALSSLSLAVVGGERFFTVDPDALSVTNVADIATGVQSATLTFQIRSHLKLQLVAARSTWRNAIVQPGDDYELIYGHAALTHDW